jgi:sugar lactone lactonase YvrE
LPRDLAADGEGRTGERGDCRSGPVDGGPPMKTARLLPALVAILLLVLSAGLASADAMKVLDPRYKAVVVARDTPFAGVNGATIGKDGALYVVHTATGSGTRIDLKTRKATTFIPPHAGAFIPDDITTDDQGNFYVTGMTPIVGEVYRIDPRGAKTVIASGLKAPNGIQWNPRTGRLFMTECFQGNRVFELDPTGAKPPRLMIDENVITIPEGFGFDRDTNDLIIPDMASGKILRVHPDTAQITTIAEKFAAPVALKVGPDNKAYIVELATGAVYRLSLDGHVREKLAQLTPGLDNLALTQDGALYVTSYWDATVFKVATDGSGKHETLVRPGLNQPLGLVLKSGKLLVADAIMLRTLENGTYVKSKLNAWAAHNMPLPLGLADGPGDQVFWPDAVHGAIAIGNPTTGEFKAIAGELKRPTAVLMDPSGSRIFVTEFGNGQLTEVSLTDGAKRVVAAGLEGPLTLARLGDSLYVAESKAGRVSRVDPATGKKEIFVVGIAGKPDALADDGAGNLLVLDGASQKLLRVDPKTTKVSVVAVNLPIGYASTGSYPPVEFPLVMAVAPTGDIYIGTAGRGIIKLEKQQGAVTRRHAR